MAADQRYGRRLFAAVGAVMLLVTACEADPPPEPEDDPEAVTTDPEGYCAAGGTGMLRWAHDHEPPDLHHDDPANNLDATGWIQQGMLEGLYGISSQMTFVPELLAFDGEVTEDAEGTFTYHFVLREDIRWSDGTPITGQTVKDTWDIIVHPNFAHSRKSDYERIAEDSWEIDGQAFSYSTDEFFAGFPTLFARLYPAHAMGEGEAANDALRTFTVSGEPIPASGPFVFDDWTSGQSINLPRNDDYHGSHPDNPDSSNKGRACVDGVAILFVANAGAQPHALFGGEADIMVAQPEAALVDLGAATNIAVSAGTSAVFEHWGMNTHNPHLSHADVREALAYAIDKRILVDDLYGPLYGGGLPPDGDGATYFVAGSAHYVDHQTEQGYGRGDIAAAVQLLEGAGYVRNAEGMQEHPERGVLELRVSTTSGDELRERQQQLLQEQLAEAGIRILIDNTPGDEYFTDHVFGPGNVACSITQGDHGATVTLSSGDAATAQCDVVDIVQFAWVTGPWPARQRVAGWTAAVDEPHAAFRTGSERNPYGYANPDFDALSQRCDATVDDDERMQCYHVLDRYVTTRTIDQNGLIVIPLAVKPAVFAYSTTTLERVATVVDAADAGPLVHGADYLPAP